MLTVSTPPKLVLCFPRLALLPYFLGLSFVQTVLVWLVRLGQCSEGETCPGNSIARTWQQLLLYYRSPLQLFPSKREVGLNMLLLGILTSLCV